VGEIRAAFFTTTFERVTFTKAKREALYLRDKKSCKPCTKEVAIKHSHLDHIKPLAAGGSNADNNLQILCRECHFEKTQQELLNQEYVRVSKTTSSYNTKTLDIITSVMSGVFPFIEPFAPQAPRGSKLFTLDLIKSRKNAIYHSQHDFPLFTVMDEPVSFADGMSFRKPGIYFVESDLYFPIRGNGWYSHVMTSYLVDKQLVKSSQIRYAVHSSLRVPSGYFNELIDAIYAIEDGYEKFKINCMVGLFKPSKNDHFRAIAISSDPRAIYYHYLQTKASFIDTLRVGEVVYYHLLGKYHSRAEESETPLCNMTLEMENINLYEMCKEIERLGGTVLGVNTDCAVCVFPRQQAALQARQAARREGLLLRL